jgi:hypothetical protein
MTRLQQILAYTNVYDTPLNVTALANGCRTAYPTAPRTA